VDGVLSLEGDDIVPGSEFANLPENQQSILAAQSDVYNLGQKKSVKHAIGSRKSTIKPRPSFSPRY